jgi:hypothetical protein
MTITRSAQSGLTLYVATPNADWTPNLATVAAMTETSGTYSVTVADGVWGVYQQLGASPASGDDLLSMGTMTDAQMQANVQAALTAQGLTGAKLDAIQERTDNLPDSPAAVADVDKNISVGSTGNITIE